MIWGENPLFFRNIQISPIIPMIRREMRKKLFQEADSEKYL